MSNQETPFGPRICWVEGACGRFEGEARSLDLLLPDWLHSGCLATWGNDSEPHNRPRLRALGLTPPAVLKPAGKSSIESPTEGTQLNRRIQAYLRSVAPLGRDSEQVGPFLATFSPGDDNPYLNYAVPADWAEPTPTDVSALIEAYARRGRRARLEYVNELAPGVEGPLLTAGFRPEGRLTLMAFTDRKDVDITTPPNIDLGPPETDDDLYAMAAVQADAYGDRQPDWSVVEGRKRALARGAIALIARDVNTGVVGAGSCSPIRDGLTEVAAIGVATTHRRQGIATALSQALARKAIARGAQAPWLMAGHDAERRIYERAGFTVTGQILHISLPE